MGLLDRFKKQDKPSEKPIEQEGLVSGGKYDEPCALCGKLGSEKKWMGQFWHKKCVRKSKKFAKGMI